MRISICLPTYNRAKYLKQAISSVLAQTYTKFEFLILDDGSTDSTPSAITNVTDPRLRLLRNPKNLGYVASLNKCAQLATGEWVLFMSDDDVLLPTLLEKMVGVLAEIRNPKSEILKEKIGMVVPQTILIDADGEVISKPSRQLKGQGYLLLQPTEFIPNYTLYGRKIRSKYQFNTAFPSTLFRRDLFLRFRGDADQVPVAHDLLIGAKIALKYAVVVIDEPLIKYRVHANWGSSLNRRGKFLSEHQQYLKLLLDFVREERIEFNYDFKRYCYNALVKYLFQLDGGLLRLAARFEGGYLRRLKKITEYLKFGLRARPLLALSPTLYLTLGLSLLPQRALLVLAALAARWRRA